MVDNDSDHRVYVGKSDHVISLPDDQGQLMCKFGGQTYSMHHPVGEGFAQY